MVVVVVVKMFGCYCDILCLTLFYFESKSVRYKCWGIKLRTVLFLVGSNWSQDSSIGSISAWYRGGPFSKGENFSVKISNWIVWIWIRIYNSNIIGNKNESRFWTKRPSFPFGELGTFALFEFLWETFIKTESSLLEMLLGFNQTLSFYPIL